jgi:sialate O-acetylesterase
VYSLKKIFVGLFLLGFIFTSYADVMLPSVIDSGMVLQRGAVVPIWGWAEQGEEVTVEFAGQVKRGVPDETGRWMVTLDPMEASSESRVMKITGSKVLELVDVLVGEVWLASGQSNMEWTFSGLVPEEKTYALLHTSNRFVRAFHVEYHVESGFPLDDTLGRWKDAEGLLSQHPTASAVAFFFALKLQQQLGIPVAFIDANWGGRQIEPFIPDEGYQALGLPLSSSGSKKNPAAIIAQLQRKVCMLEDAIKAAEKGLAIPYDEDVRIHGWAGNGLHNGMIAPVAPFAIKGVIWYQGESNRGQTDYFKKLQALSFGWSKIFNQPDIPFYQVQIAPYNYTRNDVPSTTLCDTIWAAQYKGAEEIPGMGIVAVHDTNIDVMDIHPRHKRTVGERLAAQALRYQYGRDVAARGPGFSSAVLKGSSVEVSFNHLDQGLSTSDGEPPSWFELSADGVSFAPAEAVIRGDVVEVSAVDVPAPAFVRMGWQEIAIPNLCDSNGWPAFAFAAQAVTPANTVTE